MLFKYYKSRICLHCNIEYKSLIQSFPLNIYYVPGTMLGTEEKVVNKKAMFLLQLTSFRVPTENKERNLINIDDNTLL